MKVKPKKKLKKLIEGKVYLVIGIEAGSLRIIDEAGKPYLYEPIDFEIVDLEKPEFWLCETGEDGEEYCYPKEWAHSGFFEDYFDGINEAKQIFNKIMQGKYAS